MSSGNATHSSNNTNGYVAIGDCFAGIYYHHNVNIKRAVSKIDLLIKAISSWASLNEVKIYIGRDNPTYMPYDLLQDSARTWVILEDTLESTEISELKISGKGNLAFFNNGSLHSSFVVRKISGDQTGTMHIGKGQHISMQSAPNSIVPTSVTAYQVSSIFLDLTYCEYLSVIFCI